MSKIGAVILAAGMSKRMGKPKLLLPLHGTPLFHYVLKASIYHSLDPIVLIAGPYIEEMRKLPHELRQIEVLYNPNYATGMASSLKLGMEAMKGRVDAAIIFLADQPFVPAEVVQTLIKQYKKTRKEGIRIVRSAYEGVVGHPILFDAELFSAFDSIDGDQGGKPIIQAHQDRMKIVSFDYSMWGRDIDTPEDLMQMEVYLKQKK
ncbi:NTP transferase domain-containing protein [Peribacillus sp. Hz7]|uniref:nucleotidyltransferase family protein n=1 Tax=Peribacillus sp. Hz7 TaxID=3344873 RepID=UPI0035CA09FD